MKQEKEITVIQRRKKMIEFLEEHREATVKELSERYMVSEMTVRRDFHYLEEIGIAEIHYGGASLRKEKMLIPSFAKRDKKENPYKKAIGRTAAGYVKDGDSIFLDVSSTVFQILRYLPDIHVTVITNSMPVIEYLYPNPKVRLCIAPGTYDPDMAGMQDFSTIEYIRKFHVDKAFIGCMGCNPKYEIACSNEIEGAIKSQMRKNAEQSFLMVDHTKFRESGPVVQDEYAEFDYILTDSEIDEEIRDRAKRKNRNLILCNL